MCRGNRGPWLTWLQIGGLALAIAFAPAAWGQALLGYPEDKIARIEIKHIGPNSVSDTLIRGNIRSRVGEPFRPITVDDDVKNLYRTGLFYNIRVTRDKATDGGVVLTYVVQANPRLTDIKLQGNVKLKDSKIRKKITSKIGEPLDERKLFTDSQAIQELYQKGGYPRTEVKYVVNIDEAAGKGTATFEIKESPKIKITAYEFVGGDSFSAGLLREQMIGWWRRHFSWLIGYGRYKEDDFETGKETLAEFYRNKGYIDFDIKEVELLNPTPRTMLIRMHLYEGQQYRVGKITFDGTTMLPTNAVSPAFRAGKAPPRGPERTAWSDRVILARNFKMKEGDVFTMANLAKDTQAVEDFYDSKGHIDVGRDPEKLKVTRVPNTDTSTMDIRYEIDEGQKSFVEKVQIRGNTKTKDRVIRRELAISPGETFDMVKVRVSKRRLEGLDYFSKVEARPENTDVKNRKDLLVAVEEKNTGNLSFGAGFSSVDAIVGFAELTQGNFDIFHPPTFTGGGQKFRLRLQLGTRRQDIIATFTEPWFLNRKLQFETELYHRKMDFQSTENLYDEVRTGARFSLDRALWTDFFRGGIYYTIENVGILLNESAKPYLTVINTPPRGQQVQVVQNTPNTILGEDGYSLLSRAGVTMSYDTRNDFKLPNSGQRTELTAELTSSFLGGQRDFYKLEGQTAWFFRGLLKGHVLELGGRGGVTDGLRGDTVPFYERYYLGGLYSLRGFEYRAISPRESNPAGGYYAEPIGGYTYWFASAEYSIPLFEKDSGTGVRFAVFYDIGSVGQGAYDFNVNNYSDNWGVGLRLNLPIGPLRLDYGFPLNHDRFSDGKGRFQFGVGWQRPF